MKTVNYVCTHPMFSAGPSAPTPRPYVEVIVRRPSDGQGHRVSCLLDSGSDVTILDTGVANHLGFYAGSLPQISVAGITGTVSYGAATADLEFAGTQIQTLVLLGPANPPVLGRSSLFATGANLEIGLEDSLWLHT